MRKLETYVNEKLKVTNNIIYVPDLSAILNSKDIREFNSRCEQLSEYLKNDSDSRIAELKYLKGGPKQLSKKYENSHDTFLWVKTDRRIFYGTWNTAYSIRWSGVNNTAKCYDAGLRGFKEFLFYDNELSESGGVFVITENDELMEQIDYLTRKS